jgi:hydroxyethylthiazole kinase-like uncharacterized protein yjeF
LAARPILTVAEMAAADCAAIEAGTPQIELMERAGKAVADAIVSRFSPCPTAVLCGPGDNGGDGYVAARWLAERGWDVWVEALAPPNSPAAVAAAARWTGETVPLSRSKRTASLFIDALFGAGLNRPLDGEVARVARASARSPEQFVAVDVPSGLSGDLGRPIGEASIHAGLTVTFHARKPAHVLQPGRALCGEVVIDDIGLGERPSTLFENDPQLWGRAFPWPAQDVHKHSRGRLIVVSGERWSTGAARLAARGALRIGAGLVTLLSPPEALAVNAAHLEAVMLRGFESDTDLEQLAASVDAAIIGPAAGVGEGTIANVLALARTGAALVLDADALTSFEDEPDELFSVLDRDDVLTPHPGEFERLFPDLLAQSPNRIIAAREAAREADAVVVLKGADTVIAAPDGRAAVNLNGSPWLATAGSGDVLAGLIGGLLAQGMESFEAACAGVWIHAEAGASFGPGLTAEDLPGRTPPVLRRLYDTR